MKNRKTWAAKLVALPVLALCGFLAAATFAGVGIGQTNDTSTNETTTTPGHEGCTPGYWKNLEQHGDEWIGLTPGQTLESVFNVPNVYNIDNITLIQALGPPADGALNGAGPDNVYQLLRHAIAGILNANNPDVDYPLDAGTIIGAVNVALFFQNADLNEFLKNILAAANEAGCPLN